jgi:hypothetical protein
MNECCHCKRHILDKSNYAKHMRICNKKNLKKTIEDSSASMQSIQVNNDMKCIEIVPKDYLSTTKNATCSKQELQCELCRKIFNKKFNFHRHLRVHFLDEIMSHQHDPESANKLPNSVVTIPFKVEFFECTNCGRRFNEKRQLDAHRLKWHSIVYTCSLCQMEFGEKFEHIKHMNSVHSVKFKFECQHCLKSFRYLSHYFEHRRSHLITNATNRPVSLNLRARSGLDLDVFFCLRRIYAQDRII